MNANYVMDQFLSAMEPGTALTLPVIMDPLPEGGKGSRWVTFCKARPGVNSRVPPEVFVDAVAAGVWVTVEGDSVAIVVRVIRIMEDYWVEFLNPAEDMLDGLCEQEDTFSFLCEQPGEDAVRKIVSRGCKAEWRAIRDHIRKERMPRSEDEFASAVAQFLAGNRDLATIYRRFKASQH